MEAQESIRQLCTLGNRSCLGIEKIKGDASSRQYFRVTGPDGAIIACIDPAFRTADPEKYPFLVVRDLLALNGIPVPAIIDLHHDEGLLFIEDCGNLMLQDEVPELDHSGLEARYRQIIDILVRIQSIKPDSAPIPFSLSFDHEKLMFEFDFFIKHALGNRFRGAIDPRQTARLREAFSDIATLLVRPEHFVLNHRDFHSRNIMLFRNEPVIIDFQDARLGLPQYDAVSLLRDSYVSLDTRLVDTLKRYHYTSLVQHELTTMSKPEYLRFFDLMAFQRNIKAVGTFCYQSEVIGNQSFEPCILPTLAHLRPVIEARPELSVAGALLDPILSRITP